MSDIEREEFEQAVADKWSDSYKFTRFGDEDYYDEVLEGMWRGWQASRQALEGESVAVVDRVGIMQRLPPYTNLPEGTKLYTHPASRQAVSVPEETLTAIHDTLRLVWSRELSADDGLDEIEILIPPTKADEWIKCSERLPSEADHYLVALSDPEDVGWVTDKAWTAFYNKCGECPEIAVEIVEDGQPVTHWMPLPAPPQEQGQ